MNGDKSFDQTGTKRAYCLEISGDPAHEASDLARADEGLTLPCGWAETKERYQRQERCGPTHHCKWTVMQRDFPICENER